MRKSGFSLLSLVAGVCLLPAAAFAQDAPAPAPAPGPGPRLLRRAPPAAAEPDHAAPPGVAPVPDSAAAPAPTPPTAEMLPLRAPGGGGARRSDLSRPPPSPAASKAPTIACSAHRTTRTPRRPPARTIPRTAFCSIRPRSGVKHQLNEYVYGADPLRRGCQRWHQQLRAAGQQGRLAVRRARSVRRRDRHGSHVHGR